MTGLRRPVPSKFVVLAAMGACAASLCFSAQAEQRSAAPIKYMGQGATSSSAQTGYSKQITAYAGSALPAYSQPVRQTSATENPRTKRIEFRYPDQPGVSYGSDGVKRKGQGDPIKYSSQESAMTVQSVKKIAAVSKSVPSVSKATNPPVLHQPAYARPAIEESRLEDLAPVSSAKPSTQTVFAPSAQPRFDSTGIASWYGEAYHGQPTANGEVFDMNALTAAHPTLPLPSLVQVTNLDNGREVVVRVNDRGPFVPNRMIDMSRRAADELGFLVDGSATVSVRYLGPAPVADAPAGQGGATSHSVSATSQTDISAPAAPLPQPRMAPIPNPAAPAYFIQAGSFSDMSNAERLSEELSGSLPVDVAMANVNGADFFRVLIGPYPSRSEAAAMRDQLDASGIVRGVLITGQK